MKIAFDKVEDNPSDNMADSSWVLHTINARRPNGDQIGYINISYIPAERYKAISQTYKVGLIFGISCLKNLDRVSSHADNSLETLKNSIYDLSIKLDGWDAACALSKSVDTTKEGLEILGEKEVEFIKRYSKEIEAFESFHVDSPLVDYIKVVDDWRGMGVGESLYREASNWLEGKRLLLHASGLQNESASRVWDKMCASNMVQKYENDTGKIRRVLSLSERSEELLRAKKMASYPRGVSLLGHAKKLKRTKPSI